MTLLFWPKNFYPSNYWPDRYWPKLIDSSSPVLGNPIINIVSLQGKAENSLSLSAKKENISIDAIYGNVNLQGIFNNSSTLDGVYNNIIRLD